MMTSPRQALQQSTLYTDELRYAILHLPGNAITAAAAVLAEISAPFSGLLVDKDEVTLIISAEDYEEYQHRLLGHRLAPHYYRLITFDQTLEFDLVGFLAHVTQAIAQVGIPIMAYAAFQRDHLLIPESRFEQALAALQQLKDES